MEKLIRKWQSFSFIILVLCCCVVTSCGNEDFVIEYDDDEIEEIERELPLVNITSKTYDAETKTTVYNMEYSSTDPFGNPVMLSGCVIFGDEVMEGKHAKGMVLYNHFTIYHKNECPSRGGIFFPQKVVGSGLVAVAADYYGFGSTENKNQAYCMSRCNAQASIDALLAARELLKREGYSWGSFLFNTGYSEGAQTSIGVLRLCAEKYPDIRFTHTIVGGGPYDMGMTFRELLKSGSTIMPSSVINTLLAYNEFCCLGIERSEMLKEPTLSKIDKYLLSKDYSTSYLEKNIATQNIADWMTADLLDINSEMSSKLMSAFEKDNLTSGWTPRRKERITLIHNILDDVVPVGNTTALEEFFAEQGLAVSSNSDNKYNLGNVYVLKESWTPLVAKMDYHDYGAVTYVMELFTTISKHMNIPLWISVSDLI